MEKIEGPSNFKFIVEALSPHDPETRVKLGITSSTLQNSRKRGVSSIAQFMGIVRPDLVSAEHAFQGLRRPLFYDNNTDGDDEIFVYTWRSRNDYVWVGSAQGGNMEHRNPPSGYVFVALVRMFKEENAGVSGEILYWNWAEEDPGLKGAPVDSQKRYKKKLWSK